VDKNDCKKCARDIVLVMQEIHKNIEDSKQGSPKSKVNGVYILLNCFVVLVLLFFGIPETGTAATKDKKKKKKSNKGSDSNKMNKESPQQNAGALLNEFEPEDKEDIHAMTTGISSNMSKAKGKLTIFYF